MGIVGNTAFCCVQTWMSSELNGSPLDPGVAWWAAQVSYETDNFLTKNRDFVVAEHQLLLEASSQVYVAELFPPDKDDGDQVRPTCASTILSRPVPATLHSRATSPAAQRREDEAKGSHNSPHSCAADTGVVACLGYLYPSALQLVGLIKHVASSWCARSTG